MARSVNKVILLGNLGVDPDLRDSESGTAVCTFSLATSESVPAGEGQYEEKTEWHRIVAFGKVAENAGSYLKKGRQVYVEGKLRTTQWTDREDIKRYTTEIVAQQLLFLGSGSAEGQGAQSGRATEGSPPEAGGPDSDIPF